MKASALLRFVAIILTFFSAIMAVAAGWRAFARARVTATWPTTQATVDTCSVRSDHPFNSDGGGVVFWVGCDVRYVVNGRDFMARVQSTSRQASTSGVLWTWQDGAMRREYPEEIFGEWVDRHPRGSAMPLRYKASNAATVALTGTDDVLDPDPVAGTLAGAVLFGGLALLAYVVARGIESVSMRATAQVG